MRLPLLFSSRRLSLMAVAGLLCMVAATDKDSETAIPDGTSVRKDIIYADRPTGPLKLDLLTPAKGRNFPLVLWVHGGAWKSGDKAAWPHMNFLLDHGFAVANVEYRFSQVAPFPAQLTDCAAALQFLVEHAGDYHLDPTRIAVTGESAGGHLAALLGMEQPSSTTQPTGKVRAVIDLFGPADLAKQQRDDHLTDTVNQLFGGQSARLSSTVADASPINHVSKTNPPFLILHGTVDAVVPIEQSRLLVAAMKKAGVSVDFIEVQGAGHAGPAFWTPAMRDKMVDFLNAKLDVK